ncbi:MAG: 30S ribosomal protein S8 [Elusimicrobia bacterium]|nr:30S ribosomal protein S8 [Elusimicrobiota bacterium]
MVNDPVADMLTRIRNANAKFKDRVDVPFSKLKLQLSRVLKEEGFIANYKNLYSEGQKRGVIRVFLRYTPQKEAVLKGIRRVSRPGLRVYRSYQKLPKIRAGYGVNILSTPKGILTDRQAVEGKVGGEVLCQVW